MSLHSLPPKHGKIRTNIGKLFGKLRSSAGQSHHQSHSGYEPAPSEGSPSPYHNGNSRDNNSLHAPRGRLSPVPGHIEMQERGSSVRTGREVVSPLAVPARVGLLGPPPPTPPRRYSSNAFFPGDNATAINTTNRTLSQQGRAGNATTFSPIAIHESKFSSEQYHYIEDSIDDIGDFTLVPSTRKASSSGRQHKHNGELEDEYEAYVV